MLGPLTPVCEHSGSSFTYIHASKKYIYKYTLKEDWQAQSTAEAKFARTVTVFILYFRIQNLRISEGLKSQLGREQMPLSLLQVSLLDHHHQENHWQAKSLRSSSILPKEASAWATHTNWLRAETGSSSEKFGRSLFFLPRTTLLWYYHHRETKFLRIFFFFYFTILYWFCHTLTWISHGCTCVPHPEHPSHLPPHPIPLSHPSAPAPSTLHHASNLDWRFISHMIIYMFQCCSPESSHPHPLPQSPKDYSIHVYRKKGFSFISKLLSHKTKLIFKNTSISSVIKSMAWQRIYNSVCWRSV